MSGGKPVNIRIWDSTSKVWEKWDGVLSTGDLAIGAVEIKDHDGTDRAEVTSANALKVDGSTVTQPIAVEKVEGVISTVNSSTTTLGSGGVFTGTAEDVTDYKSIGVNVYSSHVSATDGMTFQFSSDGTNWDKVHSFTIPATTAKFFNLPVESRYFRIVYTNSANVLTAFRLQTIYHATMTKESTLRLGEDVDAETAAQLHRSVIAAKIPAGSFTNVQATTGGNLKMSIEEVDSGIGTLTQADGLANTLDGLQTTTFNYVYNGTTWDRARGDLTNGMLVNLGANNDITMATLPDTAAGDLAALVAGQLADGHNVTIDNASGGSAVNIQDGGNTITVDGDVNVTSVISGTGATNLGKAIDSVVGATDTGIALLAKHNSDVSHLTTAEGDYDILRMANLGGLHVAPEQHHIIDSMSATTGWGALSNDTINLATTKKHVLGTDALTFDKADGGANTVFAGIEKTISSVDLGNPSPHDLVQTVCYIPDLTDVSYVFIRLGTDSSNYSEWRIEDTNLTAAIFEILLFNVGDANYAGVTGNGWDPSAITYVAVGVAFDSESDTLAGIVFDEISFHTNLHTSAELNAEVSSSVSSAKVDLQKINGSVVDKGAGNVSNGSQRVVLATDQPVVSVIDDAGNTLLGTIDTDTGNIATQAAVQSGWDNAASDGASVSGDTAHDVVDAGEPIKIGAKAIDMGATPTAVAANDRTNLFATRGGQLFTIGGHPNILSQNLQITDADGAQTNTAIVTVAAGTAIVVTQISVNADNANSVNVSARIGFGTASTPAADAAGVVFFHPGIPAGGGQGIGVGSGIIGVGATNEDLRITCEDPVGGSISVQVTYYTVLIGA
jgi:hypothetical protein